VGPLERLRSLWNRYWFSPSPAIDLDVLRIVAVATQLLWLRGTSWWWGPTLDHLARTAALPDLFYKPIGLLAVYAALGGARPSIEVVSAIYWVTCGAGIFALVGLYTRYAVAVLAAGSLFLTTFSYSFSDFHHPEAILLIALLVLAVSPVGRTLSIDALRVRLQLNTDARAFVPWDQTQEIHEFAGWPVRFVRVLFAMVYLSAALSKLSLSVGLFTWANGETLQYYMIQDGIRFSSDIAFGFAELPVGVLSLFSWGALLLEGTFWLVLVWPRLALFYLPSGIGFHVGVYATQRAAFFQYPALYACFIPFRRLILALRQRLPSTNPAAL